MRIPGLREAFRSLRRSPGFSAVCVLTLGLGLGANVAVLSIVDRLVLRPLPFPEADELVQLHDRSFNRPTPFTALPRDVGRELVASATSFDHISYAGIDPTTYVFDELGSATFRFGFAANDIFEVLRTKPLFGGVDRVVSKNAPLFITYRSWADRFQYRGDIIGVVWHSSDRVFEVAGVLPASFVLPSSNLAGLLDGVVVEPNKFYGPANAREMVTAPVARLKSGVSMGVAQAEVAGIYERVKQGKTPPPTMTQVTVQPLQRGISFLYRSQLWSVVVTAVALLLIAIINVSILLVVRRRASELAFATRMALGASRKSIVGLSAAEATLLCGAGSLLALLIFGLGRGALEAVAPSILRPYAVGLSDGRLLAIVSLLTALCALVCSILPARQSSTLDIASVLRDGGRAGLQKLNGGSTLLAAQIGLSAVLLALSLIACRAYAGLVFGDRGFEPAGTFLVDVRHGYKKDVEFNKRSRIPEVLRTIKSVPGVVAVGVAHRPPVGEMAVDKSAWQLNQRDGGLWGVTADLLPALGVTTRAGRLIGERDIQDAAMIVVLNETGTRTLWPGASVAEALGRSVKTVDGDRTVVGVIADLRRFPAETPIPAMFVPITAKEVAVTGTGLQVIVKVGGTTDLDSAVLRSRLDSQFGSDESRLPRSLLAAWDEQLALPKFQAFLGGTMATVAGVLVIVGVYGLCAFNIDRRKREFAVRTSLGATPGNIRLLVYRENGLALLIGLAGGLGLAWAAQTKIALLTTFSSRDPMILLTVAGVVAIGYWAAATLALRRAVPDGAPKRQLRNLDPRAPRT